MANYSRYIAAAAAGAGASLVTVDMQFPETSPALLNAGFTVAAQVLCEQFGIGTDTSALRLGGQLAAWAGMLGGYKIAVEGKSSDEALACIKARLPGQTVAVLAAKEAADRLGLM